MQHIFSFFFVLFLFFTQLEGKLIVLKTPDQTLSIVQKYLPKNPIILEAGAFDGNDSIRMAKKWVNGTIHCFEPIPDLYEQLEINIKNWNNIYSHQLAIGEHEGIIDMYVSELVENPGKTFASSSLLPPKHHLTYAPYVEFPKSIKVATTTFDLWAEKHCIPSVDFLWLDMQGYELNALQASPKILDTVKVILTEVEFVEAYKGQYLFKDMKKFLEKKGFTLIAIDKREIWFGDALFVRTNLLKL